MRDLFTGRCDPSVTAEDLNQHNFGKFSVKIKNCICISHERVNVRFFQVTLTATEIGLVVDAARRAEYLIVRKYLTRFTQNDADINFTEE